MPKNAIEIQRFMEKESLASFATVSPDGGPHVVPVFFTYENGKAYIQTGRQSLKVRNLLSNNKVALAVYSGEEAVILRGQGRIVEGHNEFIRRTKDHISKYHLRLDKDGKDSMGIPLFDESVRCVVEVISQRTVFW